jgi:hypothetical protein
VVVTTGGGKPKAGHHARRRNQGEQSSWACTSVRLLSSIAPTCA